MKKTKIKMRKGCSAIFEGSPAYPVFEDQVPEVEKFEENGDAVILRKAFGMKRRVRVSVPRSSFAVVE